jgi:pimeloyl-ACP methyl ester carboxylesterase
LSSRPSPSSRPAGPSTLPDVATTLVLLPGLDGTDVFFRPLLSSLPRSITPVVINYPGSGALGYADLLQHVRRELVSEPEYYVLGWSFSGPLALMLAAAEPDKVTGVILSASFVRAPQPGLTPLGLACVGPVVWLYRVARRLPVWLFKPPADPLRRAKTETWQRVSATAVAARMRAALRIDARELLCRCRQPLLYLAASHDRVVPRHNADEVMQLRPASTLATIEGRHLAMYTNPEAAAQAIVTFIDCAERQVQSAVHEL